MKVYDVRMPLYEVRLSVEGGCNYNCIYCGPFADGKKALGYGTLMLDQANRLGELFNRYGLHVQITGGEPSLRNDLDQIVLALSSNGIKDLGLSTNGSRIDIAQLSRIIANGLSEIHFHIPSTDQATYERTVRNSKSVREVLDLAVYSKGKIDVEFNTPVTPVNLPTLSGLLDFCLDKFINIKLIEEVSLSDTRIKEEDIERFLESYLDTRGIRFTKMLRPLKYGHIYETDARVRFRIIPVTPNLIEHIQGKKQNVLLDGRFWVGGQDGRYVFTPSYFVEPSIGSFEDLEKALDTTKKLYEEGMAKK